MKLHYSKEADALYIRLKELDIKNSDEANKDLIIDYDEHGNIIGLEILSVSEKADMQELVIQSFDKVKVETAKVA